MYVTVAPSYGRDYTSARAAKADWEAGKDFTIQTISAGAGRQISKPEADAAGIKIMIRYKRMTQVTPAPAGKPAGRPAAAPRTGPGSTGGGCNVCGAS